MARRRPGLPEGFDLGITNPESEKPIRTGDYLDEIDTQPVVVRAPTPPPVQNGQSKAEVKPPRSRPKKSASTSPSRTRLNVSTDGQRKLDAIWARMREFGPEPTLRKSEIIEAMILATYDARDQLDLSNVRRRGKYGSATHKNFPIALAESIKRAMSDV